MLTALEWTPLLARVISRPVLQEYVRLLSYSIYVRVSILLFCRTIANE